MGRLSIDAEEIGCILFPLVMMIFYHFIINNKIEKLKKQVKRIRILIKEGQFTDNLPRFYFR
ncbi:Vitellogenin [Neochlamydia sp. S13]|nr:Vitellogenin [Neochlamydia sp. S13]